MFYSAHKRGFYDDAIHSGKIPPDAVEITVAEHAALLAGQSAGKEIVPDASGRPVLADPPPPPVPEVVSMRQARLAMLGAGLLQNVNDAISEMTGVEGEAARIEWEYAVEVRRDSQLVQNIAAALSVDAETMDQLFTTASTL